MGSSFSSLNKSWGCTSFGTSGNRSNRKELSGFCHCPKNCPSSYVLPSALQTKTNSLPIDELSTSIITSPTVISTYSCTCKNSLAHHQIISDTRASNVDSSYQLCGVNSEAFVPTDSNISIRVFIPRSDFHQEQLYNSQTQCINNVEKFVDIDTIKKESIFTDPLILTDCALEQFRNLISSWSCNDLCCLYLEYEAVYELQLLWKEAIKTRLRAPTLKDDLWSLAQHGWCSNTYLIRNDSTHEAHSYLLASRLSNFDELLTSLNRGKFHRSSNKSTTDHTNMMNITSTITITNTSNTVLNNKASINSLSTSEGLVDQSSDFQSEKCPDLLSSSRLKLQDTSYKMNTETHQQLHHHNWRKLPGVSILDPNSLKINTHDVSNSSEMFLTNFLCQLYTGNDPQQLLSKPDLLYQPEVNDKTENTCNTSSNLSKLYNFLKYSPQHKCLLSNDCELIFTCTPILNLTSITLPCHAGILACRSQFLRRILLKRYKANTITTNTTTTTTTTSNTQNSIHKIILDGKIIPGHFATVILHFFYCDYLNLNEISNLLLVLNQQTLLNKLHFNWHTEHSQLNKTTTNNNNCNYNDNYTCCKSSVEENHSSSSSSTIPVSKCTHTYSSSYCTESESGSFSTLIQFLMNTSEFYVKRFCLRCPFCLTHIIQLYPVGAILEFHKLSEVCEDLLAEALSLPSIGFENCENSNWKNSSTTTKRQQDISSVKMSSISLAVGLLRWIDEKSPFTSSSLPEPFLNTQFLRHNNNNNDSNNNSNNNNNTSGSPIVSQQSKPNEDSSSPMDNQYVFKSNDNNSHVSFPYNGTSLGFVYRHAIHCLRQNFTSLVRSPSILQRLSSQQLYELLDSSLVQAPESEILAGLLCWGELQLKLKRKNTCSGVQSSNGCPNRDNEINIQPDKILDNLSIEYQSILTSIIDNPSIINCSLSGNDTSSITNTEENDLSYFNHWLLLCNSWNNVENSIKRPTNIDCTSRLPSCHLCHGTSTAATTTTNNNANNKSVSSESFILNHNLDKMITYTQLIDLVSIVNLLNEHNLLDCIRPAHLLSPMPNELASVLLRYYCDKCQHLNAHNSSTVILNSMNTLHSFGCCQSKDFFNSPWNSLIQLTKSSQSICSEKQFTLEKVLSNPLSNLSPAQFSEKYHWASLLLTDDNGGLSAGHKLNSTNINVDDDDDCVCCWNKQHLIDNSSMIPATGASVVRKSWSDNSNVWLNYTNRVKSQLKFLHLPPRLYYPFLNEVRMLFIQKHAVHHQRLHLMNNNNNADNFHSQSQSSECTCWEFLLSRRFDQSCNLTNFSPNTTKRIHQSSSNKYHNKSFNLNHQQPYTTDIIRDYSQDFSSECDLSFPDLAKKRFGSKSIENNDHNNVTSRFFMNKKFTICCDYKCRDFAYCLLPSSQWTSIIDYYMRLVREFMNDPISHHPCTNNKYVHHILRLRSLWKYGLPDSLESLLICRINEYMFMLQQPPPTPSTKQQVYITDCCNPMKNTNTLIIKKNNSSVSTLTITTTTSTASSSSSISVCSCSLPVMNMTYCEHHTTQRCTFNPSDIGWKSIENTGGSTIITTTTTSITSRTSYSLSSNNLRNSSGIRNNTINKLTRNSNHNLVSLSKASQSCSICDDQVILCSVPKNHKLSANNKVLFTSNEQLSNSQCLMPSSCKECQNLLKSVKPYCHHNDSYFPPYITKQQKACVQCITSSVSNSTYITDFDNLLLPTYFSKNQFKNGIYSDPNHLLNYGSLFSSVNDRKWTKSKSNYHHNVYRSDDQQRCHHRQQTRRQQQSSDIFCCPPYDHKLSSEMLTTTSFSPCYRKVLFNNDDGEDEIEKKPICCPYASYSQQTLIQPSPSLSSAISLVHLKNTDGDLRVTSNHNDISSRSNHTVVTEEQYETRLMKLSTKKYDDDKNHLNNTIYLPLLLTLPCNVSDQDHYNISSSFTRKSDLSSDSTNSSSSSSSSSTSFSSPFSGASN
ncbi:unnamed protein product [Schistosoma rodhaini]|nr:unnamed protein product [Schistosoma rodhaini]